MRVVLLAHAGHVRVQSLQATLDAQGLPAAVVVPWRDWLNDATVLLRELGQPCWLKLEAPGEDEAVLNALIAHGAAVQGLPPPAPLARGELAHGGLWYAGFANMLHRLSEVLCQRPWVRCLNTPEAILALCDKLACQQHLQQHQLPVPELLGAITDFDELRQRMQSSGLRRVFVKPRYGSSASGVLALQSDGRGQWQAQAALEMGADGRLYNSLRVRRYSQQELPRLLRALAPNEQYAEAWIPKPRAGTLCFDLRIVTLKGRPLHRIARLSAHPMTNLHLGNERRAAERCLDVEAIARMEVVAAQAARCFPDAAVMGVDIIAGPRRCHVLELNAFGDWLPGLHHEGRSVHEAQIEWLRGAAAEASLEHRL